MKIEIEQWKLDAWREGNDAGEGYGVGRADDTPLEAAEREGWKVLVVDHKGNVIASDHRGDHVMICDANGPWAVTIAPF